MWDREDMVFGEAFDADADGLDLWIQKKTVKHRVSDRSVSKLSYLMIDGIDKVSGHVG